MLRRRAVDADGSTLTNHRVVRRWDCVKVAWFIRELSAFVGCRSGSSFSGPWRAAVRDDDDEGHLTATAALLTVAFSYTGVARWQTRRGEMGGGRPTTRRRVSLWATTWEADGGRQCIIIDWATNVTVNKPTIIDNTPPTSSQRLLPNQLH